MKQMTLSLIALTFLLSGIVSGTEPEKQVRGRQLMFRVRVLEGDPLGSLEAGTIKKLAEPTLVTRENIPFNMTLGNEIPFNDGEGQIEFVETGIKLKGLPGVVREGELKLDLSLTVSNVEHQSEGHLQLNTKGKRVIFTAKLAEVTKIRFGETQNKSGHQRWVELIPELVPSVSAR